MPEPLPKILPREQVKPEKRKVFTARDVAAVFIKYEARCAKCHEKVSLGNYQIDHITPISALGKHELENWQLLCVDCHKPKTANDNREAKKGRRIRREAGQQKRRREKGPLLFSRNTLERREPGKILSNVKIKSRPFDKTRTKGFDGKVRVRT